MFRIGVHVLFGSSLQGIPYTSLPCLGQGSNDSTSLSRRQKLGLGFRNRWGSPSTADAARAQASSQMLNHVGGSGKGARTVMASVRSSLLPFFLLRVCGECDDRDVEGPGRRSRRLGMVIVAITEDTEISISDPADHSVQSRDGSCRPVSSTPKTGHHLWYRHHGLHGTSSGILFLPLSL